ncbi:MAG: TetR/AcrR family transcriptional regulator, lmrAB and yxaGH operons repressor [Actinomycetota bacterium]|nr:TetR/AcrR family transcriptional regulator, lmrAB and yxaGH operons repressor [Actinomycetota bacterium]
MPRVDDSRTQLVRTVARLLRDQGYTATGLAQVLTESGVSNGSLYHHFPGGMEELAQAALETSGQAIADALSRVLDDAPNTGEGIASFLDVVEVSADGTCQGCPIAPTALESSISPRLRTAATRCFNQWEDLLAGRLRADGWPAGDIPQAASAALSLIEGALLLARVTGQISHLANAKQAARALFAAAPTQPAPSRKVQKGRTPR